MDTNVLDTVVNSSEKLVDTFCEHIVAIFAHDKTEIVESLQKVENDKLLKLRSNLFGNGN